MKKLISLVLVLCAVCLMVPAMAEADITGEWYGSMMGLPMTLVLNADGSAAMEASGNKTENVTWVLDGEKFTLTIEGTPAEGTYADGVITLVAEGASVVFTREPVQAITVGEVNPDAKAEDFNGEWKVAYVKLEGNLLDVSAMGQVMPNITIENSTVKLAAEDSMAMLFGQEVALTYENGALVYSISAGEGENALSLNMKAELLQDGLMALTFDLGSGAVEMYYSKVTE